MGLECWTAIFPIVDVMLYITATITISIEPFSFAIAFIGPKTPTLLAFAFNRYVPIVMSNIPTNPDVSGNSPSRKKAMTMINTGLKAINGMVRDKGESFIAFT